MLYCIFKKLTLPGQSAPLAVLQKQRMNKVPTQPFTGAHLRRHDRQRQTCKTKTYTPAKTERAYIRPLRLQLDSRVSSVDLRGFVTLRIRGAARSSAQFYASLRSSTVLRAVSILRVYLRALIFFTRETSRSAVESSMRVVDGSRYESTSIFKASPAYSNLRSTAY